MNSIIENFTYDYVKNVGDNFDTNDDCDSSLNSQDSGTVTTVKDFNYIDNLIEDELLDMENEVFLHMEDFLEVNILQIANPVFEEKLISKITDIMYDACSLTSDADRFNSSYDDIKSFVHQRVVTYTQTIMLPRSCNTSVMLNEGNIEQVEILTEKIEKLRNTYQPQQRTIEWYEYRHELITASNIGKIIGTEARKNSLIYEKCKPFIYVNQENENTTVNTTSPMHWGVKYEPVTIMIYEHMYDTKIEDFGCIQHSNITCLGSSPDGINSTPQNPRYGRMLEVKNIVNRIITGIPQHDYWVQCQIQMEVCNLDTCDFIETRIKEYEEEDFYGDETNHYKGVVLYFVSKIAIGSRPYYQYMPIEIDSKNVNEWILEKKLELRDTYSLYQTIYWYLDELSVVLIPRNKKWFTALVPLINETWNTIVQERITGFQHRAPKKKTSNINMKVCKLDENFTKSITL
jgi:putative phage-type endonuclease